MNSLDLSGLWHYCPEDSVDFARADFDHSLWPTMHIPHNWFLAGLDHHGVVWFRRRRHPRREPIRLPHPIT